VCRAREPSPLRGEGWVGGGSTRGPCLRFQAASLTAWLRVHPPLAPPLKGGELVLRGEGWVGVGAERDRILRFGLRG
jgi:hypothetical protein